MSLANWGDSGLPWIRRMYGPEDGGGGGDIGKQQPITSPVSVIQAPIQSPVTSTPGINNALGFPRNVGTGGTSSSSKVSGWLWVGVILLAVGFAFVRRGKK
ncbi:MAG TPA: hypothetical protein VMU24_02310 [Candidatus Acidoferrales bacterium]|nr:hypothetical protein [Candidatus Acidoferrales bacterium]